MINRSEIKKMLVWDEEHGDYSHAVERYVLFVNDDGSCVAVNELTEEEFHEGISFDIMRWDHCKPIPEKKTVKITDRNELMAHVMQRWDAGERFLVQCTDIGDAHYPQFWNYRDPEFYKWIALDENYMQIGEPQDFVQEVTE